MEAKEITVKELIKILLEQPMNDIIVLRDEEGNILHNVQINSKESTKFLGALFG